MSSRPREYDPAKARGIMETVIQQHPDLCGVIGNWDNQDVGAGAAIQEAGKADDIYLVTSGGGNKIGCDNIDKGLLDLIVSYDVPLAGHLHQPADRADTSCRRPRLASRRRRYYTPLTLLTKENMHAAQLLDDGPAQVRLNDVHGRQELRDVGKQCLCAPALPATSPII